MSDALSLRFVLVSALSLSAIPAWANGPSPHALRYAAHAHFARFMERPSEEPLASALIAHRAFFGDASSTKLLSRPGVSLELRRDRSRPSWDFLQLTDAAGTREPSLHDLRALGIRSMEDVRELMRSELKRTLRTKHHDDASLAWEAHEAVRAVEAKLEQRLRQPDAELLLAHLKKFPAQHPKAAEGIVLGGDSDTTIALQPEGRHRLTIEDGGGKRALTHEELQKARLLRPGKLEEMLGAAMLTIAGTGGDAKDPAAVDRARTKLRAAVEGESQADPARHFRAPVLGNSSSAWLWAISNHVDSVLAAYELDKLVIAKRGLTRLEMSIHPTTKASGFHGGTRMADIRVVGILGRPQKLESWDALDAFGLRDSFALAAAVDKAIEALPLPK